MQVHDQSMHSVPLHRGQIQITAAIRSAQLSHNYSCINVGQDVWSCWLEETSQQHGTHVLSLALRQARCHRRNLVPACIRIPDTRGRTSEWVQTNGFRRCVTFVKMPNKANESLIIATGKGLVFFILTACLVYVDLHACACSLRTVLCVYVWVYTRGRVCVVCDAF